MPALLNPVPANREKRRKNLSRAGSGEVGVLQAGTQSLVARSPDLTSGRFSHVQAVHRTMQSPEGFKVGAAGSQPELRRDAVWRAVSWPPCGWSEGGRKRASGKRGSSLPLRGCEEREGWARTASPTRPKKKTRAKDLLRVDRACERVARIGRRWSHRIVARSGDGVGGLLGVVFGPRTGIVRMFVVSCRQDPGMFRGSGVRLCFQVANQTFITS